MYETIRHIEYLLMYHDCVCVPGLGAFMTQYVPAVYDDESGQILPPRRVSTFNAEILHDDGLLCSSVSRRDSVSFEEARRMVECDVRAIHTMLDNEGELRIGNLGLLHRRRRGNLEFRPNGRCLVSPALSALSAVTIPSSDADNTLRIVRRRGIDSMMFRIASVAASLVLVLMLVIGFMSPSIPDATIKASLEPMLRTLMSEKSDSIADIDFNPAVDLAIAMPDSLTSMSASGVSSRYEDMRYVVVVASLINRREAESFVENSRYDGVNMTILDGDSRCRVVVDGGQDLPVLAGELMSWREIFPSAWIYQQK